MLAQTNSNELQGTLYTDKEENGEFYEKKRERKQKNKNKRSELIMCLVLVGFGTRLSLYVSVSVCVRDDAVQRDQKPSAWHYEKI